MKTRDSKVVSRKASIEEQQKKYNIQGDLKTLVGKDNEKKNI